jgi:transcriptional regulator with XRE-family HTH domain
MNDQRLGASVRAIRLRRGWRQLDLAERARVSRATISTVERGHWQSLSVDTLREIAAVLDIRVDVTPRWRGGDLDRLLSRRHSMLAEHVALLLMCHAGWASVAEVSFSIYGERGVIDQLAWHEERALLLILELKTEFADMNETLGTLGRKRRLARTIAAEQGWRPEMVSVWLLVSDTRTNRRHAAEHAALLETRFKLDGRQFCAFLREPVAPTTGLAFMTDVNPRNARQTRLDR